MSAIASPGAVVGPSFTAMGFLTFDMNATCAPSSWRVRSPIHRKCADVSYGSPDRESMRVSARS